MDVLKACFPCVAPRKTPGPAGEKQPLIIRATPAEADPDGQVLETVLRDILTAKSFDLAFRCRVTNLLEVSGVRVRSLSWREWFAERILDGIANCVDTQRKMGIAIGNAYDDARKAYREIAKQHITKQHPVWEKIIKTGTVIIALGILAEMLPWMLEWLGFELLVSAGFSEVGPVAGSYAARWMSIIAKSYGQLEKGSLYSYFQRMGMVWSRKLITKA